MLLVNQLIGFGAGGGSGIEFVGYKTATAGTTATNIAINSGLTGGTGSAAASGDFVLVAYEVTTWSADLTLSITDGTNAYTLVGTEAYANDTEGSINFRVAYKFITSDTSVTIGSTTSSEYSGIAAVLVFRNVSTSTPLDVSASVSATAGTDDPVFSAITPVTPGAVIVAIGASAYQTGPLNYADPGGLTGFVSANVDTGDNDSTIGFGRKNDWVSGSYTPPTFVLGSDRFFNNCAAQATIALRPSGTRDNVSITRTADPASASAVGTTVTYSSQSIGAEDSSRIVVLCVTSEKSAGGGAINSATIDYGGGAVTMTALTLAEAATKQYARIFYAAAPTGTTATFTVTFAGSGLTSSENHINVYRVVGGSYSSEGTDSSLDMDATDPLTTGSITIPAYGAFIGNATCSTESTTMVWTNATEDLDATATGYRYSTAIASSPGAAVTITCRSTDDLSDGALAWAIFV